MVSLRRGTTWYGQPVVVHDGFLGGLRARLPSFSRQPFGPEGSGRSNGRLLADRLKARFGVTD